MEKLGQFEILFRNPYAIYKPGEVLHGTVRFRVYDRFQTSGIYLIATGDSYCKWYRQSYEDTEVHSSYVLHFIEIVYFFDSYSFLVPGNYLYKFQISLPSSNLPHYFHYDKASTKYYCRASITFLDRLDLNVVRCFNVIGDIDYNSDLKQPFEIIEWSRTLGSLCFKSKPINVRLDLKKRSFVSGETIDCQLKIENNTSRNIKLEYVALKQAIYLIADYNDRFHDIVRVEINKIIGKRSEDSISDIKLQVPAVSPSFNHAKVFEVGYFLLVSIKPGKMRLRMKFKVPILIGSVCNRKEIHFEHFPTVTFNENFAALTHEDEKSNGCDSDLDQFSPLYRFFYFNANI